MARTSGFLASAPCSRAIAGCGSLVWLKLDPVKGSGTPEGIEIFPKHDELKEGDFGNAIRGPLGIHRVIGARYWFYGADYTIDKQVAYLKRVAKTFRGPSAVAARQGFGGHRGAKSWPPSLSDGGTGPGPACSFGFWTTLKHGGGSAGTGLHAARPVQRRDETRVRTTSQFPWMSPRSTSAGQDARGI